MTGLYWLAVFFSGFTFLALEILARRIFISFLGPELIVWTHLITVFLFAGSIGYLCSTRKFFMQRRVQTILISQLVTVLFLILASFAPKIVWSFPPFLQKDWVLFILFLSPVCFLSALQTPILIQELVPSGRSPGFVFLVSSIGSVLGALSVPYFFFWLREIESTRVILELAVVHTVLFLGILYFSQKSLKLLVGLVFVFLTTHVLSFSFRPTPWFFSSRSTVLYTSEGVHSALAVVESGCFEGTRICRYLSFGDPTVAQGGYEVESYRTAFPYARVVQRAWGSQPELKKVLIIGLGPGIASADLLREAKSNGIQGIEVTAVEPNRELIQLNKIFFKIPESQNVRVVEEEGRRFLRENREKYDLIFLDAFANRHMVSNLMTVEFFEELKNSLSENGVFAWNTLQQPWANGEKTAFEPMFLKIMASIQSVFPESAIEVFNMSVFNEGAPHRGGGNVVYMIYRAKGWQAAQKFWETSRYSDDLKSFDQFKMSESEIQLARVLSRDVKPYRDSFQTADLDF